MDHIEYLNQIVDAERRAQEIAQNAQKKRESLNVDLKSEESKMREGYMSRAERRIERVRAEEFSYADKKIGELDAVLKASLELIDAQAAASNNIWADEIFSVIVGLKK